MSWQGWTFMLLAWLFIGILFFYSFKRILFIDKKHINKKEKFDNNRGNKNNN